MILQPSCKKLKNILQEKLRHLPLLTDKRYIVNERYKIYYIIYYKGLFRLLGKILANCLDFQKTFNRILLKYIPSYTSKSKSIHLMYRNHYSLKIRKIKNIPSKISYFNISARLHFLKQGPRVHIKIGILFFKRVNLSGLSK